MRQNPIVRTSAAVFLFMVLTSVSQKASAFTPGACRQDAEKLCPGVKDKDMIPCLKIYETSLSTACLVNLAEVRDSVRDARDACKPDIEKFCAGVQTGQGRIRRCLKAHEAELTSACQAQIAAARKKYQIPAPATTSTAISSGTK